MRLINSKLFWLAAYLATVAVLVAGTLAARRAALRELGTPTATAEWRQWREAARKETTTGPVRRRLPESTEPPGLVLLRDHFAVVLTAAVIFGSLLFGMALFAIRGLTANRKPGRASGE